MKKPTTTLFLLILFGVWIVLSGCGRVRVDEDLGPEVHWEMAKSFFEHEKYLDAIDLLTSFTLNYSGSTLIDSAQFLLGECHFVLKEYILAESEYSRLLQNFPQSPLVDDAWLKIILCNFYMSPRYHLDQKYTEKTVNTIGDFLDEYSSTDLSIRLAAPPTTIQAIGTVFTFGIWKPDKAKIEDVPLSRTKVIFPSRSINFGQWLLRVFTFGIYKPRTLKLQIPPSTEVDGDWVVREALYESRSRLAEKDFSVGEQYYRMKKYPSAVIYFDTVLGLYDDTPWAERSLRLKGDSLFAMRKYEEAAHSYERYLREYEAGDRKTVQDRLEECRRLLQRAAASPPEAGDISNP